MSDKSSRSILEEILPKVQKGLNKALKENDKDAYQRILKHAQLIIYRRST